MTDLPTSTSARTFRLDHCAIDPLSPTLRWRAGGVPLTDRAGIR